MKQDLNGVRTAQDLERKYDFSKLNQVDTIRKATKQQEDTLTRINEELQTFVNATTQDLDDIHNQIDGNITTYYHSGVPTLSNYPASEWDISEYAQHVGDMYYDQDTGYAYRFILDSNDNYSWTQIQDSVATRALALANQALDTADSKRRIFVTTPFTPYDVGDVWIFNDSELLRCSTSRSSGDFSATDWVSALAYTDDTYAKNVESQLNNYKETVKKEYVSNSSFTKAVDDINMGVKEISVEVNMKNTIFTEQPTPPYIKGDAYVIDNKIFTCINARSSGDFDANDWSLNLDESELVNQADFDVQAKKIESNVTSINNLNTSLNNTAQEITNNIDSQNQQLNEDIQKIVTRVQEIQTSTEAQINVIKTILENGVEKVSTTTGTFDENGLSISKTNAPTESNFNEDGMIIYSNTGNERTEMQRTDSTGTYSENVTVRKWLIVPHSRFQNYQDGTGCFFVE